VIRCAVGPGVNCEYTWQVAGVIDNKFLDKPVWNFRADHGRIALVRQRIIIGELPLAGNKPLILLAPRRNTDLVEFFQ
jgi:hypothetical protein